MGLPNIKKPNININKTSLIIAVISVVAAVGILLIASAVVSDYQAKAAENTKQRQAELQAAEKRGYDKGLGDYNQHKTLYSLQTIACKQGVAAYEKLTVAQKRTIQPAQVPKCRTEALQ